MINFLPFPFLGSGPDDPLAMELEAAAEEEEDEHEAIIIQLVTGETLVAACIPRAPQGTYADYLERETLLHLHGRFVAEGRWETQFRFSLP